MNLSIKDQINPNKKDSLTYQLRRKRFQFFLSQVDKLQGPLKILDIGGTPSFWESMGFDRPDTHITLLNLTAQKVDKPHFSGVKGDAREMKEYEDGFFDIVFSNSVIEHLYTKENQQKMAKECRRVGKNYFIQTPNYWFPIEPHWVFPFFQYLPFSLKVLLTRNFKLGHIPKLPKDEAIEQVKEVRLLTAGEMKKMFPDGSLYREKFFGLTKSLVAYKFGK